MDISEAASRAAATFAVFESGAAKLTKIGLAPFDQAVGGVGKGGLVVIGLDTGLGKTSLALHMLLSSPERGGYCSMEDPEDLIGARILAWYSGVDPLKIRTKALTPADRQALREGLEKASVAAQDASGPILSFLVGRGLGAIEKAVEAQAAAGAKYSILDYLQKVRTGNGDRRSEIGQVMGRFQAKCDELDMVPVIFSQFSRPERQQQQGWRRETKGPRVPTLRDFKESGDIENEARVGIVGWSHEQDVLNFKVLKSAYGGAGLHWKMRYDASKSLREMTKEYETW